MIGLNTNMRLRETFKAPAFHLFVADLRIRQKYYSQAIKVQAQARNAIEAKKQLMAQYGPETKIISIRRSK